MKATALILAFSTIRGLATEAAPVDFTRLSRPESGVTWDCPALPADSTLAVLASQRAETLLQQWSIDQGSASGHLIDQKLLGAYLPTTEIKVVTLDTESIVPRTRVDQPFTLRIETSGLLTGPGLPDSSTRVLLQQHNGCFPNGQSALDAAEVRASAPVSSGYITANGTTVLKFPASSLKAGDPTKASGEEHFLIHTLAETTSGETQIASAMVQVWPVASGSIRGITAGQEIRGSIPDVKLQLDDLYPHSDTTFVLFSGRQINGVEGTVIASHPLDQERSGSGSLSIRDPDANIPSDGTYTVALMSETVYGKELLCDPVTFTVKRADTVAAEDASEDFPPVTRN